MISAPRMESTLLPDFAHDETRFSQHLVIARVLDRDHQRGREDATIVAARYQA